MNRDCGMRLIRVKTAMYLICEVILYYQMLGVMISNEPQKIYNIK